MGGSSLRARANQSSYDVSVEKDIFVEMRDGALLATDLYRPAEDETPIEGKLRTRNCKKYSIDVRA